MQRSQGHGAFEWLFERAGTSSWLDEIERSLFGFEDWLNRARFPHFRGAEFQNKSTDGAVFFFFLHEVVCVSCSSWGTCWTSASTPSVSLRRWRWSSPKCWWRSSATRYQRWSRASLTRSTSTRSDSFNRLGQDAVRTGIEAVRKPTRDSAPGGPEQSACTPSPRVRQRPSSRTGTLAGDNNEKEESDCDPHPCKSGSELWKGRKAARSTCDKCDNKARSPPPLPHSQCRPPPQRS